MRRKISSNQTNLYEMIELKKISPKTSTISVVDADPKIPEHINNENITYTTLIADREITKTVIDKNTFIEFVDVSLQQSEIEKKTQTQEIQAKIEKHVINNKLINFFRAVLFSGAALICILILAFPPTTTALIILLIAAAFAGFIAHVMHIEMNIDHDKVATSNLKNITIINHNIMKQQTFNLMQEILKDTSDDQISAEQYKTMAIKFTEILTNQKNNDSVERLVDKMFTHADIIRDIDFENKKWLHIYIDIIAKFSKDIVNTCFTIIKSATENEDIKKIIDRKKSDLINNPQQFSENLTNIIFNNYFSEKEAHFTSEYNMGKMRKATIQGFINGINSLSST